MRDFDASTKTPVDYASVDVWQLKKGMFVEGDIPYNFGAFEEQYLTVNGVKTSSTGHIYMISTIREVMHGRNCGLVLHV